jgi:hypothetical protein
VTFLKIVWTGSHIILLNWYRGVFLGVKGLVSDSHLSPPTNTEVKDE